MEIVKLESVCKVKSNIGECVSLVGRKGNARVVDDSGKNDLGVPGSKTS